VLPHKWVLLLDDDRLGNANLIETLLGEIILLPQVIVKPIEERLLEI
jgi:hypothetical protein